MSQKIKRTRIARFLKNKEFFRAVFAGVVFYGTLILVFNILTSPSHIFLIVLLVIGLIGTGNLAWVKLNPMPLSRFFHFTTISVASVVAAIYLLIFEK